MLVHRYVGVNVDIILDVVETHLPPLAEALEDWVDVQQVDD